MPRFSPETASAGEHMILIGSDVNFHPGIRCAAARAVVDVSPVHGPGTSGGIFPPGNRYTVGEEEGGHVPFARFVPHEKAR